MGGAATVACFGIVLVGVLRVLFCFIMFYGGVPACGFFLQHAVFAGKVDLARSLL
jgi:hypothetical protein